MLTNYDIEPYKSNGHFSCLFKGIHRLKKNKVVIKTHYDEVSKRLMENEIKLYMYLQRNNYRFIPWIKNILHQEDKLYIIMDYKSTHLYEIPLTLERIQQLIHVIRSLHALKVVHRDIKPDNFLIEAENIFIIDFGLSTFHNEDNLNHLIGNKKYCSYKCHEPPYVYSYNDDMISLVYMCLDLHNGYVAWSDDYTIKKRIQSYYKADPINSYLFMLFERYLSEW